MNPFFTLVATSPYIELPQGLGEWFGFLFMFGILSVLAWQWRTSNQSWRDGTHWISFGLLLILQLMASLFFGVRLPSGNALPPPGLPVEPISPAIMIVSAVPWMLAGCLSGPWAAGILGMISGLTYAMWETHTLFTPLEFALLGVICGAVVRQRYRTSTYRLFSHPLAAALLLVLIYPLIHLVSTLFSSQGVLVTRLDYALTNLQNMSLAVGIELLIAGLVAEGVQLIAPGLRRQRDSLLPSPSEKSLQTRFVVSMAPLAVILIVTMMAGNWLVAGRAASDMLNARMANTAEMASYNVPYFLETGQNLIRQIALDPRLLDDDASALPDILAQEIKIVPFFNQLTVYDAQGLLLASHPTSNYVGPQAPIEEQMGLQTALGGVPYQIFTVPPTQNQQAAQVSFVATLLDENQQPAGVLVGRSDLANNPLAQPMMASLNNLSPLDGQGMLLDENNRVLVHTDPAQVMTIYTGRTSEEATSYEDTGPDGTRQMVYYQPALGRPWAIVLTVPAYRAQQLALNIAAPLLGMILFLSLVALVVMRLGLRAVTASLQTLTTEAGQLALGKLDQPLPVDGEDEVAQLRRAFEQMRVSLKARLDELNRLLLVSQGVASSLEMAEALHPVLEASLVTGASSARVILTPTVVPELDGASAMPTSFGVGLSQRKYEELDELVMAFTRHQDRLVLSNLTRPRLLNIPPGVARPESLMAVALRHENLFYGTLWIAFDEPHTFSEEEVRFMVTLGGQAALATANASLFLNAEIGRQRLAAILASSPDPVLVTDQRDRLLLANPAAWQAVGMSTQADEGKPIQHVVSQPELLDLLLATRGEKISKEVTLSDGRVYLATATPVLAEGQRVGRVCVLRDVTHFKELDALKSDFVATVSHDLRSPLTLMRGYATMLEMVGQLNEQQTSYVRKIVTGVESMSRLVNNLLDLGRIEAGIGLQLEMTPVPDIIERVVGALQIQAAQKRIQLASELGQLTVPLIEADQALLQQALHNLVENAIKYTRPDGKVHVRVQTQPGGVLFEVGDSGIGVSPMDMPRLFEKFYRGAHQMSKEQRGTGLGLAIVKSIAERHGGRVWAESQLGKGSVFFMLIPIHQPRREMLADQL